MKKTYCLDTNVLIHDPRAIFGFEDNCVVITEYVLLELDQLKAGTEERNHSAREASNILRTISLGLSAKVAEASREGMAGQKAPEKNTLPEIAIPGTNGGTLVLLMDDPDNRVKGEGRDDQILGLLHRHRDEFKMPILMVTKDTLMAIKSIARGFGHQDYRRDQAKVEIKQMPVLDAALFPIDALFAGRGKAVKVPGILTKTYQNGGTDKTKEMSIIPGYYLIAYDGAKQNLLHIDQEEDVRMIIDTPNLFRTKNGRGIRAKNLEQNAAVDALLNPAKTLVCLLGPAGTGKTLLAIAAALDIVKKANPRPANQPGDPGNEAEQIELSRTQRKQFKNQPQKQNGFVERKKILIARPMISMGEEMGFLPGDIEDKMRPWIEPIVDNFKLLIGEQQVEGMFREGTIEMQPLQYIRGRSIDNAILIIDEAQNTKPLEIKTIITRAGKNCRIILTGDTAQIDVPYLDKLSNGLSYAADRLGQEAFTAVVPLTKGERSWMATRASELL
jgi:PhoH-like ATPase